jgi:high-affinity nickel-transport protein
MFDLTRASLRSKVIGLYAVLIPANLAAWLWAFLLLRDRPLLLGAAALAYGFGLRHAIDADHIAAIDNVTRKLMQDGQRPVAVGLFFALGHSGIVFVAAVLVAITAGALQQIEGMKAFGGVVSTSISAAFLIVIGLINLTTLHALLRALRGLRSGNLPPSSEPFPIATGLLARLLRPLFGVIRKSWHMAPLGILFGLGFETATEVSVMGLSASQASSGASLAVALVFPTLFAAGMTLVDATDGVLMVGVYQWAFVDPRRKLIYNCIITAISALIALVIAGIETAGLVVDQVGAAGGWRAVADLAGQFNLLGFVIVAVFIACWLGSMVVARARRALKSPLTSEP